MSDYNRVLLCASVSLFTFTVVSACLMCDNVMSDDVIDNTDDVGKEQVIALAAWAPDGKVFAVTQEYSRIKVFEAASQESVASIESKSDRKPRDDFADWLTGLTYSPDGHWLAGCRADGTISLWTTSNYEERARIVGSDNWLLSVHFSPDSSKLVTGGRDRTIKVWDVHRRKTLATLTGHTSWVHCVAFSPCGQFIVSGSEDGTVRLWDATTGRERRRAYNAFEFRGKFNRVSAVTSLAVSPDGKRLVYGDQKSRIRVIDVEKWEGQGSLTGHASDVLALAFLPDNNTVLSGSRDRTVRAWNLAETKEVGVAAVHNDAVYNLSLSPDHQRILVATCDGSVRLMSVNVVLPDGNIQRRNEKGNKERNGNEKG